MALGSGPLVSTLEPRSPSLRSPLVVPDLISIANINLNARIAFAGEIAADSLRQSGSVAKSLGRQFAPLRDFALWVSDDGLERQTYPVDLW